MLLMVLFFLLYSFLLLDHHAFGHAPPGAVLRREQALRNNNKNNLILVTPTYNYTHVSYDDKDDEKILNHRKMQEKDQNQCFVCSRLGTRLIPNLEPLPLAPPGYNCDHVQTVELANVTADSVECEASLDLFEQRCCDQSLSPEFYDCAANIRSNIFNSNLYDRTVPPVYGLNGTMRLLKVETLLTFVAVERIDVKTSTLEIFVGIELKWNDPRLKWDIESNDNCATKIIMRADHSLEETEIWTPLLDLKNRGSSLQDLAASPAVVKYDGTVEWKRLGSLKVICAFTGLRRMPFDDLGCQLIFGDNGGYEALVDYKLAETKHKDEEEKEDFEMKEGILFWPFDVKYEEFSVVKEKVGVVYPSFRHSNSFYYQFYFHRARRHYVLFVMLPDILFTYISFGQFALDIRAGERLSFSITIVLITVTHSIVIATLLPICREMIWLNAFNLVSMIFTLVGIFETMIVFWMASLSKQREARRAENEDYSANRRYNDDEVLSLVSIVSQKNDMSIGTNFPKEQEDIEMVDIQDQEQELYDQDQEQEEHGLRVMDLSQKNAKSWRGGKLVKSCTKRARNLYELTVKMDCFCLVMLPIAFSIYIIVMFGTNQQWDDDG